jgi:colanic acid/amylovoran biosynthesis protein
MKNKNVFILAGNGPYTNRGCEAIVRGTVKILRHHFDEASFLTYSQFKTEDGLSIQKSNEEDSDITHDEIWGCKKRFDCSWFATNVAKYLFPWALKHMFYRHLKPNLPQARAALALGGDNYSLDYASPPIACTALDDLVVSRGKPLVIWGASVGPFSKDPAYEKYILEHFRKVHILARESLSCEYLNNHGLVENVHQVADPAFLLDPREPDKTKLDISIDEGAIGVNISPLLANYNSGGDKGAWAAASAKIVEAIIAKTERTIYLVPHVTGTAGNCDYSFLRNVADLLDQRKAQVFIIPDTLDTAETKWVISKMDLFVGARTHATIASLSSCVPTLSFGYSVKSRGINQDIFGHTKYCIQATELTPDVVAERVSEMLKNLDSIKEQLREIIPEMKDRALSAGSILKEILSE